MRKTIIAGNWKMNMTPTQGAAFVNELKGRIDNAPCEVLLCPPAITIPAVVEAAKGSPIEVGAQEMHQAKGGAYTGKLSTDMILDAGCSFVIIGHSERRQYFGETDAGVNLKTLKALAAGLRPIVCVGETLDERDAGETMHRVSFQVWGALAGVKAEDAAKVVIAYEPVWAIGTGRTATPEQAQEVHAHIRQILTERFDAATAAEITLQYGGSVKPSNVDELMAKPDVDGALVGGASLKVEDFQRLVMFKA